MNKPPDLPPEGNESAPRYDKRIDEKLAQLGSFDGQPWFRIVWGQSDESRRFFAGRYHFKYLARKERVLAWGQPKIDLAGQFCGYEHIYKREDVIPAGVLLDQLIGEIQVGLSRFIIEIATYYSEDEWKAERYRDEQGSTQRVNGKQVDFLGEYPTGGIDYEMLWLCAAHKGCCIEVSESNNVGVTDEGKRCFGFRRLPNETDVVNIRARVRYFEQKRAEITEKGDQAAAAKATAANALDVTEHWEKVEAQMAEDNYQVLLPRLKRLTSEGSGLDLFKYTDMAPAIEKHEKEHGPLIGEK